jgi:hypothetical protein
LNNPMRLSIRAYASHRGVSDMAVHKAIRAGPIAPESHGTIDPARADRDWARHTEEPRAGTRHGAVRARMPEVRVEPPRQPRRGIARRADWAGGDRRALDDPSADRAGSRLIADPGPVRGHSRRRSMPWATGLRSARHRLDEADRADGWRAVGPAAAMPWDTAPTAWAVLGELLWTPQQWPLGRKVPRSWAPLVGRAQGSKWERRHPRIGPPGVRNAWGLFRFRRRQDPLALAPDTALVVLPGTLPGVGIDLLPGTAMKAGN